MAVPRDGRIEVAVDGTAVQVVRVVLAATSQKTPAVGGRAFAQRERSVFQRETWQCSRPGRGRASVLKLRRGLAFAAGSKLGATSG
jgi:hypothetical protein